MSWISVRAAVSCTKSVLNLLGNSASKMRQFSQTSVLKTQEIIEKQQKVVVDGLNINYVQVGTGKQPVLLLPGAMGSIWTDFRPQIEKLNRDKLTIVAWDPPGCGNSRPPDREFPLNFFEKDASYAHDLMKKLGFLKYSLVGWSDGGITSMFLAAMYPKAVEKVVMFGSNAFILPDEMDMYESIRNIDKWSERMRAPLLKIYGEEYFRNTWSAWVDGMKLLFEKNKGDICKGLLHKIMCPTLIIHGNQDAAINKVHPVYLKENITNSELIYFEEGAHNLHLRYPEKFNKTIETFLLK